MDYQIRFKKTILSPRSSGLRLKMAFALFEQNKTPVTDDTLASESVTGADGSKSDSSSVSALQPHCSPKARENQHVGKVAKNPVSTLDKFFSNDNGQLRLFDIPGGEL